MWKLGHKIGQNWQTKLDNNFLDLYPPLAFFSFAGMIIYFFYGIRHSQESINKYDDSLEEERRSLIPRHGSLESLGSITDTNLEFDEKTIQNNGSTSPQEQMRRSPWPAVCTAISWSLSDAASARFGCFSQLRPRCCLNCLLSSSLLFLRCQYWLRLPFLRLVLLRFVFCKISPWMNAVFSLSAVFLREIVE